MVNLYSNVDENLDPIIYNDNFWSEMKIIGMPCRLGRGGAYVRTEAALSGITVGDGTND